MKTFLRHASSFVAPIVICILLPYFILSLGGQSLTEILTHASLWRLIAGIAVTLLGVILFILCVRMFIQIGKGTIMPWDPTRKLITGSLYAYVRNPMILSVLIVLVGEAVLFTSWWLALLALIFFVINTVYFRYSEEPGLEKRFGDEYREYKRNVRMWIPRLKAWKP